MTRFELLDDNRGWMVNSLEMLERAKHDYVLVWNEDHVNLAPQSLYRQIVREMGKEKCDYMLYSWWHFGKNRADFEQLKLKKMKHIGTVNLTASKWSKLRSLGHSRYLISSVGIFRKKLLERFMIEGSKKLSVYFSYPLFVFIRGLNKLGFPINEKMIFPKVNKIFGNRLPRYPKVTPHELEKDPYRDDVLPLKFALSNRELFACIDDDSGLEGYQLKRRGLYKEK